MPIKIVAKPGYRSKKFGGGRRHGTQPKPQLQRRMEGARPGKRPEKLKDAVEWERWKIERKKQSEKPVKPLGRIKKIGPKPGTQEYVQENYLLKPGYKKDRKRMNIGGRANLLEEMGRIDARKHPDAADRAEKSRVIGELNRGYNSGGKVSPATHKRNKESAKVFKLMKGKPKLAKRGWK